jgi:hypothetical protein
METLNVYTVVRGDTLFGIARKFNMSVSDLKALNRLSTDTLSVGQTLKVQGKATPPPVVPPPPPVKPPVSPNTGQAAFLEARKQFDIQVRQEAGFRRYFMTVPLPTGGAVVANMRDNLTQSRFMVYPEGIMYAGQSLITLDLNTIQSVGLSLPQARALQYVSTHEGQFDAINSYDRAIFSYGFIQFTGASVVGGSLNRLLASMEANAPGAFQRIFQRVGIDTEGGVVTVLDDRGVRLRGDDAWRYIQTTLPLYGAFIQAGFEPSLIREQLRMANTLYVEPALNMRLSIPVGGLTIQVPRLQDVLQSEAALTLVIALAINQGTGGMSRIVVDALARLSSQMGVSNAFGLQKMDELQICQQIALHADERVRARANGVLQSGLSFV